MKAKKSKPKAGAVKRGRPKKATDQPSRSHAMPDEKDQKTTPDYEEEEEKEEKDDDESDSESEDRSDEQGLRHPTKSGGSVPAMQQGGPYHTGASGNDRSGGNYGAGGEGDEEEKEYVLGYGEAAALLAGKHYPREEVWRILVEEARAQEDYETEDYNRRAQAIEENYEKMEQVMQGQYDPDAIRESAAKLNEQRTDPDQVQQQSRKLQQLRKKLYPQPHIAGASGQGNKLGGKQYPPSATGGAGQSAPSGSSDGGHGEATFTQPR